VEPDAIGQVAGELAVVGREPSREVVEGVGIAAEVGPGAVGRLGTESFAGARVDRPRLAFKINDLVPFDLVQVEVVVPPVVDLLAANVGEVGGQAVIVGLSPGVIRMIMTSRALESDAEEDLADGLGRGRGVAVGPVEAGRRIGVIRAGRGDESTNEEVERDVGGDLVAKPALEDPDALRPHRLLLIPEQVGPLQGPEVGELGAS
jgi:hypothetical protein